MNVSTWGSAPLDEPLSYPGLRPQGSFLLMGDEVLPIFPQVGRRLGYARVDHHLDHEITYLDRFLHRHGEVAMGARTPVLAFGSNACPPQLYRKFHRGRLSCVVPVTAVEVKGLSCSFGAEVGYYGAFPAVLRANPEAVMQSWITWVDPAQLSFLDSTEPGYERVRFHPACVSLVIDGSGEHLPGVEAYRWSGEVLVLDDGTIPGVSMVLADWDLEPHRGKGWTQNEVWGHVLREVGLPVPRDLESCLPELRQSGPIRDWLKVHGTDDGFDESCQRPVGTSYDEMESHFGLMTGDDPMTGLTALTSTHAAASDGRPGRSFCVFLAPQDANTVPSGWVAIQPTVTSPGPLCRRSFGRVVPSDVVQPGEVGLDITLRFSIGVTTRDLVDLQPIEGPPETLGSRAFPARSTFARVVTADASLAEMRSCYLDPGLMAFLGLSDGSKVNVSFASGEKVTSIKVRAFEIPEALAATRPTLERSREWAKYPRCGDLLGLESDFGQIYLDAEDRKRLGVDRCGSVLLTADWRDQVSDATRDIGLLVVIAAFGLATLAQGSTVDLGAFTVGLPLLVIMVLTLLSGAMVAWSVRRRMA